MEHVAHVSNLAAQLRAPGYKRGDRPFLDPDIEKLAFFYGQIADILLELSKPSFDKIGSLARDAEGWNTVNRPMTMNMNELVQLGNFPPKMLPRTSFTTASAYYQRQRLAETEFMHLATQRKYAVDSEDDCRNKYVARTLFCKLAVESRLRNHTTPDSAPIQTLLRRPPPHQHPPR